MSASSIIFKAKRLGVVITIKDNALSVRGQKTIVDSMQSEILDHKPELLAYLDRRPYIDRRGDLIIPFESNPKYHYWADGQELFQTLMELKVCKEIWNRYCPQIPYW